jgi:hypothetical protein
VAREAIESITPPPGLGYLSKKKPWVPDDEKECQFKCCHACRPSCELRAHLSLNGILRGEIPPTAAIGFGFHLTGTRPVNPADVVRNIGLRPVPWVGAPSYNHIIAWLGRLTDYSKPQAQYSTTSSLLSTATSPLSIVEHFNDQDVHLARISADEIMMSRRSTVDRESFLLSHNDRNVQQWWESPVKVPVWDRVSQEDEGTSMVGIGTVHSDGRRYDPSMNSIIVYHVY